MVRTADFKPTGDSTKKLARYIDALRTKRGITQKALAAAIPGSHQSYLSVRLNGHAAWTMDDLDHIAPLLGYPDAIGLIVAASNER